MNLELKLTEEENIVLQQILQGDLSRLLMEIAHTDHRDFRDFLKKREETLRNVLCKLGGS